MKGRILSNFTVRKIQKVVVGTWREIFPGAFEQGFLDFPFIREFTRGLRKYCCISFGNKSWSYAFCSVAEPELELELKLNNFDSATLLSAINGLKQKLPLTSAKVQGEVMNENRR